MEALDIILLGFIAYTIFVVIPSVWDEIASHQ